MGIPPTPVVRLSPISPQAKQATLATLLPKSKNRDPRPEIAIPKIYDRRSQSYFYSSSYHEANVNANSAKRKERLCPHNTSRTIDGAVSQKWKLGPPKYITTRSMGQSRQKRKDFALIIHREPSMGRSRQKGRTWPLKIHHDPSMGRSRQKERLGPSPPKYATNHRWGSLAKRKVSEPTATNYRRRKTSPS